MLRRTFHYEMISEQEEYKIKNLLHLTISNQGTNDILILGATIKPGGSYNIPSDGIALLEEVKIKVSFLGSTATGNKAYITYTTLTTNKNC